MTDRRRRSANKQKEPHSDDGQTTNRHKWRRGARSESDTGLGRINMEWIIDWRSPRKELI